MQKYNFKLDMTLGNKVSIKNLIQRHHLRASYSKKNGSMTISGKDKSFSALNNDRGWNQFKKFNHLKISKK